uniref:Uncharacterized protein n=1 Tax=Anopheles minimus TaxID=112268 RepID=A0A182WNW8_9DIPT
MTFAMWFEFCYSLIYYSTSCLHNYLKFRTQVNATSYNRTHSGREPPLNAMVTVGRKARVNANENRQSKLGSFVKRNNRREREKNV